MGSRLVRLRAANALPPRALDSRHGGWFMVLAAGALALGVQIAAPVGVPLYDGVHVGEPYRYLQPSGDQAGSPTSFASTPGVVGGVAPVFVAATAENPPQAQLIAQAGAFVLTPGATSLQVSIAPVAPPAPPPGGMIAGNVYRFSVTDQAGVPLAIKACDGCASLLLGAPAGLGEATIKRYADGAWVDVETIHAGIVALYQTNPPVLGDYAVIAVLEPEPGLDPVILAGGAALLLLLGGMAYLLFRVKPAASAPGGPAGPGGPGGASTRVPSKRKATRRPPRGR